MKKQQNNSTRAWALHVALSVAVTSAFAIFLASSFNAAISPFASAAAASARSEAAPSQSRQLSFGDRVVYQRAIEEVYWHHRIWPKENTASKPSLDAVMSQAQLEEKVTEYLRKSQALGDYWHQPIAPEQLQAEMERMAKDTKQPDVLHEIFEALGNDPGIVAECLARPVLEERLVRDLYTQGKLDAGRVKSAMSSSSTMASVVPVTYRLPVVTSAPTTCIDNWTATSLPTGVVAPRAGHTAVWTGTEMIVWGGSDGPAYVGGGKYNPTTDSWSLVSMTNEPLYRYAHTAVWTGTEMIVWGGQLDPNNGGVVTNSGGRYNPGTDSWAATSTNNAPEPRDFHTAVWTGTEMIVWGGYNPAGYENSGGRYDPATDSWTATSLPFVRCGPNTCLLDGRYSHTAVWTGTQMIVWGGIGAGVFNDGGRYNPGTDGWAATNFNNAPAARFYHTAVWTGSEMIIWGGSGDALWNTGGRYNPTTNSWSETSLVSAPEGREAHTAVWTGNEMIIWGATNDASGGRYNPTTDSWTATSTVNAPSARGGHSAVWTGTEMIIWGGYDGVSATDTGGRYCGQASPTPTPTPTPPIRVTVQTNPAGLSFTVDGTTYTATHRFSWVPGSSHTVATTSPQSGGTGVQYAWTKWSDHGAISHTVAPTANATYTATFKTQYFLTMTHGTGGRVSPASGWKNSGATVSISATPNSGFSLSNWTGSGTGSYSGPNNPASITMGSPVTETATFIHN